MYLLARRLHIGIFGYGFSGRTDKITSYFAERPSHQAVGEEECEDIGNVSSCPHARDYVDSVAMLAQASLTAASLHVQETKRVKQPG
jgi:hypothetical protein